MGRPIPKKYFNNNLIFVETEQGTGTLVAQRGSNRYFAKVNDSVIQVQLSKTVNSGDAVLLLETLDGNKTVRQLNMNHAKTFEGTTYKWTFDTVAEGIGRLVTGDDFDPFEKQDGVPLGEIEFYPAHKNGIDDSNLYQGSTEPDGYGDKEFLWARMMVSDEITLTNVYMHILTPAGVVGTPILHETVSSESDLEIRLPVGLFDVPNHFRLIFTDGASISSTHLLYLGALIGYDNMVRFQVVTATLDELTAFRDGKVITVISNDSNAYSIIAKAGKRDSVELVTKEIVDLVENEAIIDFTESGDFDYIAIYSVNEDHTMYSLVQYPYS